MQNIRLTKEQKIAFAAIVSVSVLSITAFNIYMRRTLLNGGATSIFQKETQEETKDGLVEEGDVYKFYVDGEMQTNTWEQDDEGNRYYVGVNGNACTGRCIINDVTYFFNDDGSIYIGWKLINNIWYYFTNDGAYANGYFTVSDEYGNENEFYFDENSHLVTSKETPDGRVADEDGYLSEVVSKAELDVSTEDASALDGFTYTGNIDPAPGALSGIVIAGEPAEFYMLSIAGETSGGQIIVGDRGRAYGLCQYDYRYDLVDFMQWAYKTHPELWGGFKDYISLSSGAEELVGNAGIVKAFQSARSANYEAAITDELTYMRMHYWDSFKKQLDAAGFNLSGRHVAVSAAMFSVNVNCGAQANLFIENLSPEMSDVELILGVYKIRNSLLANQTVYRYGKKGTTGRYLAAEPQMALDLYHGYTTIDSYKDYGSGVQWCGDIFVSGSARTVELLGTSPEWKEATSKMATIETESEIVEETIDDGTTEPGESFCENATEGNEETNENVNSAITSESITNESNAKEETNEGEAEESIPETTAEYFAILD